MPIRTFISVWGFPGIKIPCSPDWGDCREYQITSSHELAAGTAAGTPCNGEVRVTFVKKYANGEKCDFYDKVWQEEQGSYVYPLALVRKPKGDSFWLTPRRCEEAPDHTERSTFRNASRGWAPTTDFLSPIKKVGTPVTPRRTDSSCASASFGRYFPRCRSYAMASISRPAS